MKAKKKMLFAIVASLLCGSAFMSIPVSVEAAESASLDTEISILGTSDIHGRFMPWDYALDGPNPSGSLTQLFTIIKKVREENPNTILLDAGDMIQGNSAELFNDQPKSPMMVAMNEMNYDAWVMGNHEFNFGLDVFKKVTSQYKGQMLAGNIYKDNGDRFLPAYTIIEKAGIKIGIIGMDTPMTTEFEKGTNHLDGLVFKNPVDETKKAIKELEGKVDVIVGLMHMGLENENGVPGTGVADIAKENPELAAIFAGHMHKLIKGDTVNGVLIVEPDKYGTHVSRIDLTFTKQGDKVVLKDKKAIALPVKAADGTNALSEPSLESTLQPYHDFARADANVEVAQLKGMNLVPKNEINDIPTVQIQETPLSDFFNEVMLHYSKADVVSHQIDNDKARLDVGPIKKKDIAYNYQFALGEITVYQVTGKDLKDYMEWAVGYFNSTRPGDITVSFDKTRRASKYSTNDFFGGVKYEIDLTKPYGSRITNLRKMDGTSIKQDDVIKLGMNAYRMDALKAKGGALEGRKFQQLWSSKDASAFGEMDGTIRNRAIAYLKEVKKGVYEPQIQNNWKIIGVDTTSPERVDVIELINTGVLEIPKTDDGKYTNVASINILDTITRKEIDELSQKAKVRTDLSARAMTKGEFYHKLNVAIKAAAIVPQEEVKPEAKPEAKPVKPPVVTDVTNQAKVTAYFLNVRAEASSKAKIYMAVPKGTVLEVLGTKYGWLKVTYNGSIGYVYDEYVDMLK
ncbi:5'-nucleotidase C-terminal domain-containing protein [Paenibacillus glacialis]|uniref:2,' 3'-cyclic nucleotide 2'-phosphodiesterase n=1 Tax=Paenibacillus glacialis TaxID=494026 RepID=A0A168K9V9_9BACL|nr:5'-nucleotidase C-terminal domain-containing protein [Paenibacillus glacialis]OAB41751.1 2,' 3'-cyclic nucleotide 2'-phosphodiesterase [Paenibacillus glacialis]